MAADTPPALPSAQQQDDKTDQFPLPTILTYPSSTPPTLITQGAEARLYKTTYLLPSLPAALKYRPPKPWRHPALDARLTRHRILAEARVLARCRRAGVPVPAVYAVDEAAGWLAMEWVGGPPARAAINEWLRRRKEAENARGNEGDAVPVTGEKEEDADLVALMRRIGSAVGRMHGVGVVHGDLTTSNMMLRPWEKGREPANGHAGDGGGDGLLDGDIVIIDFGLASQSTSDEDRAVDLYVLERAFASTHSRAEGLFTAVLESSYKETFKQAPVVLKKLEEVRMRGRKRSMIG
ncbi:kinase-like protein [Daldinia loculata]|uniref:kinase-like protein n=1 Tax=Daldinia loculata TaxID=103429 RepID=UPI0020C1BB3D|nr:kinase-like protein [Daldinia loculata]KAI1643497.1 kinase-like protein [Daldinia loculata]KAI2770775.1 kinase-like protein [Daldinia loculata]